MNWLKILLMHLGVVRLVWLEDFQHEVFLRVLRKPMNPNHVGSAIAILQKCGLRQDGTTAWVCYMKRWWPYELGKDMGQFRPDPAVDGTAAPSENLGVPNSEQDEGG